MCLRCCPLSSSAPRVVPLLVRDKATASWCEWEKQPLSWARRAREYGCGCRLDFTHVREHTYTHAGTHEFPPPVCTHLHPGCKPRCSRGQAACTCSREKPPGHEAVTEWGWPWWEGSVPESQGRVPSSGSHCQVQAPKARLSIFQEKPEI